MGAVIDLDHPIHAEHLSPAPNRVETQVLGDTVDPGPEGGITSEVGQLPVCGQHRVLGKLIGALGVSDHPQAEPEDAGLVEAEEVVELTDQIRVGGCGAVHGCNHRLDDPGIFARVGTAHSTSCKQRGSHLLGAARDFFPADEPDSAECSAG